VVIHKKKQKNVEPGSPNSDIEGDAWLFTFIARGSYLIVAFEIGKRTRESCKRLFEKVFDRVQLPFPETKIQIFSDGNDDYTSTIPEYYEETCVEICKKNQMLFKKENTTRKCFRIVSFLLEFHG